MNLQQAVQLRSSTKGFSWRRPGKDSSSRMEGKLHPGKSNPGMMTISGIGSGGNGGGFGSSSRDRLVYLTTCLIGRHVEVQVKNGSVYSGIFHATDADKDFGVVLKMAQLIKDLSSGGKKAASDSASKPSKTLIVPAHDLVQVVAKDVPVTSDGLSKESDKPRDIMLDSSISQSCCVDLERELKPWTPDEDDPRCPDLENVFDSPDPGGWDQFKVNEEWYGVKSTYNEELYTTKLEKGPRTRELEEKAMRIAREIEGEETHDLHLAEERGTFAHGNLDIDEETKYSSVYRGVDDSGYEDEEVVLTTRDAETFGDPNRPAFGRSFADVASGKSGKSLDGGRISSVSLSKDEIQSAKFNANKELPCSSSLTSDHGSMDTRGVEDENRVQDKDLDGQGGNAFVKEIVSTQLNEEAQTAKTVDLQSSLDGKRDGSEKAGVSSVVAICSNVPAKGEEKTSTETSDDRSGKVHAAAEPTSLRGRPGSSASSTSESGAAASVPSAPGLSPSSSVGSLSSEKSTLNPNAKEFKLNPNAKSFVPTQSPLRPVSPVSDGSFYFSANMPTVPHMHGMPVGMGVGPSFAGPQPVLYNPQAVAMQPPQAYFPANAPQYAQQMILDPRQVMYMPGYPTEMQYKGPEQ